MFEINELLFRDFFYNILKKGFQARFANLCKLSRLCLTCCVAEEAKVSRPPQRRFMQELFWVISINKFYLQYLPGQVNKDALPQLQCCWTRASALDSLQYFCVKVCYDDTMLAWFFITPMCQVDEDVFHSIMIWFPCFVCFLFKSTVYLF